MSTTTPRRSITSNLEEEALREAVRWPAADPFVAGLRPGGGAWSWLPDGSLLCYRPAGAAGGSPGVYVVAPDGSARQVTSSGIPVGVIYSPSSG
jgi:hypothetical protein